MRAKDLLHLGKKQREEKIKELKVELIKARVSASKGGKNKMRTIKKTLARLLTLNHIPKKK